MPHIRIKLPPMLLLEHENYTQGTPNTDVSSCNVYRKKVIPKLNVEMNRLQKRYGLKLRLII
jgi:hypothetical protein